MKKLTFILTLSILLVSCKTPPPRNYIQLNGFTQGTTYAITYFDQENRDFSEPIGLILEQVDSSMSLYRQNSVISEFNRSPSGMEVDSLLAEVVKLSFQICDETNGAFDITVGPSLRHGAFI